MKYTPEQINKMQEEIQNVLPDASPKFTGLANMNNADIYIAINAPAWLQKLTEIVQQQATELEKWKREALQQYPTPDAYEAACKALHKHRERAERAEENLEIAVQMLECISTDSEDHVTRKVAQETLDRIKASQETE
ncbi:hypothetical protein [Paenibacillus elgii]|uniref:hypothetical protein n=1 Tax=Paenibacillus elgii TaxID=189691 RepID=UPI0013D17956|nr:hypothetical protein [Paenibacillus elgii]